MEIWKDIKGYEGLYQVSNLGNIKSIYFRNNICIKEREKIIKKDTNKHNRQYVMLYKNGKRKNLIVHRLVAEAFIQNPDNLPQINHIDGNPRNNNVSNLEWCTASQNMKHAYINNLNNFKKYNENHKKRIIRNDGKIYDSAYSASKDLQVTVYSIRDVLKHRIKTCKGYTFQYLDNGGI